MRIVGGHINFWPIFELVLPLGDSLHAMSVSRGKHEQARLDSGYISVVDRVEFRPDFDGMLLAFRSFGVKAPDAFQLMPGWVD